MPPLETQKPTFDQELKKDIETARQILTSRLWSNVFSDLWVNPSSVSEVKLTPRKKPKTSSIYIAIKTPTGVKLIAINETQTNKGIIYTDPAKPSKEWRSIEKFLRDEYPSFIGLATYRVSINSGNLRNQTSNSDEPLNILYKHMAFKKLEHYFTSASSVLLSNNEFISQNPTFRKFLGIISANNIITQILAEHSRDEKDLPYLYNWLVDEISHFTKAKSEHNARGIAQLTEQAFKDLKKDFPSIFGSLTYNQVVADPDLSVMAMILSLYSSYKFLCSKKSNFSILRSDDEIREFLFASYNRGIFAFGSTDSLRRYTLNTDWRSFFSNKADETFRYLDKIKRFSSLLS